MKQYFYSVMVFVGSVPFNNPSASASGIQDADDAKSAFQAIISRVKESHGQNAIAHFTAFSEVS